jgi:hypothetical protein
VIRPSCAVAVLLAALALAPAGAGSGGAALTLVDRQPLTVLGRGFKAYERTRVVVVAQTKSQKTVRATSTGRFAVRFATLDVPRCGGVFATARGQAGSFARLKIPLPACLPAASP